MDKYLYGIDFGTSNSAVSILDIEKNEIITTISLPSLLYFSSEQSHSKPLKYYVGQEALDNYLAEGMTGRFMKSIKRILPRKNFTKTKVYSKDLSASDLIKLIIKELKDRADKYVGINCSRAIIGRPVVFDEESVNDELAQKRLLTSAMEAGFTEIRFQHEPIAAAFAYERSLKTKERVLVADLGGGTTDFTFIELNPLSKENADRSKDIIASGGIYIGGDSFDSAFMMKRGVPYFGYGVKYQSMPGKFLDLPLSLFINITSWEKLNFFNGFKIKNEIEGYYFFSDRNPFIKNLITLIENNLGYQLFQSVEKVKIKLSDLDTTRFYFSQFEIDISEPVAIEEYNEIIQRDIDKISNYLDEFLLQNRINNDSIDTIFLTGGTSLVKSIIELFKNKFPNSKLNSGDNFTSVAKGLAYSGYLFN
ncbi:MAG TPA: Hsp70 family protein [Mucilaginibacter sp.]|jgi:hypothetical chaperone protein